MTTDEFIEGLVDDQAALGIEPVEIDVEQIEKDAKDYIVTMVDNLATFYYDEQFMNTHPAFKKRVETDIEALIVLRKMRRMDEVTQDSLAKAIVGNPNNASLYRALTDIQRTILNIQTKIDDTIRSLTAFMKGYQLEIDFSPTDHEYSEDSDDEESAEITTRGSKDFIQQMRGTD